MHPYCACSEDALVGESAYAPQKCRPAGATPDFSTWAVSVIRFAGPYSIRERRRRLARNDVRNRRFLDGLHSSRSRGHERAAASLVATPASVVGRIVVGDVQRVVEQEFLAAPDAAFGADLDPQPPSPVAHLDRLDVRTTAWLMCLVRFPPRAPSIRVLSESRKRYVTLPSQSGRVAPAG